MNSDKFYVHTDFDNRKSTIHKEKCNIFRMRKEQRRISIDLEGNHRIVREWHGHYSTFNDAVSKSRPKEKHVIVNPESMPDSIEEIVVKQVSACRFCEAAR